MLDPTAISRPFDKLERHCDAQFSRLLFAFTLQNEKSCSYFYFIFIFYIFREHFSTETNVRCRFFIGKFVRSYFTPRSLCFSFDLDVKNVSSDKKHNYN